MPHRAPSNRARTTRRWTAAAGAAWVLLFASSCDDCTQPSNCPLGTVQGYVSSGGQPASTDLSLTPLDPERRDDRYQVPSDSTGWYSLTVPAGRYMLGIEWVGYYTRAGLVADSETADTLELGSATRRIDLEAGALRLRLSLPAEMESLRISARLGTRQGTRLAGTRYVRLTQGGAEREYRLDLVPPGTYALQLSFADGPDLWLPPTLRPDQAGEFELRPLMTTDVDIALLPPAWIRGAVTGSWQEAQLDSPELLAFRPDSTRLHSLRISSAARPDYCLLLPVPEPVKLAVEIGGTYRWIGGDSFSAATCFDLQSGETAAGVDVVESGIACRIELAAPHARYQGRCRLCRPDGTLVGPEHGMNDYDVALYCGNLDPGDYTLQFVPNAWDAPWCPQWLGGSESLEQATILSITTPGDFLECTATLQAGGRIRGRISRPGGPATGHWIGIREIDGDRRDDWAVRTTSPDGAFEIQSLADGDYLIGVYNPRYRILHWYPGTYDSTLATPIRIADHGTVADIEWQIPF